MKETSSSAQFARDIVTLADRHYGNWKILVARSFVTGLFTALGATVGLTIVFTALGIALDGLGVLPVVGEFFIKADQLLDTYRPTL